MKKRLLAVLVCAIIMIMLLPGTALADDGEELVLMFTDGSTPTKDVDYSYDTENGVLIILKDGDYTLSMKSGIPETSHRIDFTSGIVSYVNLTLNNVHMNDSAGTADSFFDFASNDYVCTLTLKGNNSITMNESECECAMRIACTRMQIQGDGSLTINTNEEIESGIWVKGGTLLIKSGDITINSKSDGIVNYGNSDDYARYEQSGGRVSISTDNGMYGIEIPSFQLSGGSLTLTGKGDPDMGLYADSGITVSGGTFNISGYRFGLVSSYAKGTDSLRYISFTGGVTDVIASEDGYPACYVIYTIPDGDTDRSLPAKLITVGENMRVTEGGSPVWTPWEENDATCTFSTGQPIIDLNFHGVISGASSHVHIEPIPRAPETGDNSQALLWLMLTLLAGIGLVSVVFYRKRHNS